MPKMPKMPKMREFFALKEGRLNEAKKDVGSVQELKNLLGQNFDSLEKLCLDNDDPIDDYDWFSVDQTPTSVTVFAVMNMSHARLFTLGKDGQWTVDTSRE